MCEEIVELSADFEDLGGRVLGVDIGGNGADEGFPIGGWDRCYIRDFLAVKMLDLED
jgi:hypothetical protein